MRPPIDPSVLRHAAMVGVAINCAVQIADNFNELLTPFGRLPDACSAFRC